MITAWNTVNKKLMWVFPEGFHGEQDANSTAGSETIHRTISLQQKASICSLEASLWKLNSHINVHDISTPYRHCYIIKKLCVSVWDFNTAEISAQSGWHKITQVGLHTSNKLIVSQLNRIDYIGNPSTVYTPMVVFYIKLLPVTESSYQFITLLNYKGNCKEFKDSR